MLSADPAIEARLASKARQLTLCFAVYQNDGVVVRGTMLDADVVILTGEYAGTYSSQVPIEPTNTQHKSDGSVTNADVEGGLRLDASVPEFDEIKLEAGVFDQAAAALLLVDWGLGVVVKELIVGTLGEFQRDAFGKFRSECRGATQVLSQQITQTYSERCVVKRFADHLCRFDIVPTIRTGTITAVTSRKIFTAMLDAGGAPVTKIYYMGGVLRWTSGDNDGFERIVDRNSELVLTGAAQAVTFTLQDEAAADMAPGDTITIEPGCDRLPDTCKFVHANFPNFRGWGMFAVGRDRLMAGNKGGASSGYTQLTLEAYNAKLAEVYAALGFS